MKSYRFVSTVRQTKPLVTRFAFFNHGVGRLPNEVLEAIGENLCTAKEFIPDVVFTPGDKKCHDILRTVGQHAMGLASCEPCACGICLGDPEKHAGPVEDVLDLDEVFQKEKKVNYAAQLLDLVAFRDCGGVGLFYLLLQEYAGMNILTCTHVERAIDVMIDGSKERIIIEPPSFLYITSQPNLKQITATYSYLKIC